MTDCPAVPILVPGIRPILEKEQDNLPLLLNRLGSAGTTAAGVLNGEMKRRGAVSIAQIRSRTTAKQRSDCGCTSCAHCAMDRGDTVDIGRVRIRPSPDKALYRRNLGGRIPHVTV